MLLSILIPNNVNPKYIKQRVDTNNVFPKGELQALNLHYLWQFIIIDTIPSINCMFLHLVAAHYIDCFLQLTSQRN